MSVIGTFVATTDGYVGTIRTLTIHAKLRMVAVDNKPRADAPDFRFLFGMQDVLQRQRDLDQLLAAVRPDLAAEPPAVAEWVMLLRQDCAMGIKNRAHASFLVLRSAAGGCVALL